MSKWSISYDTIAKRILFRLGYRVCDFDGWIHAAQFNRMVGATTMKDRLVEWFVEGRYDKRRRPKLPEVERVGYCIKRREARDGWESRAG